MTDGISIVDEIRNGKYEVSVIATFNAYFPFYEQVLLPHLKSSGSRQNVILMDAEVCGDTLMIDSLRPQFAGKEYFLLPIKAGGAFHPKLIILLGRQRGLLLVGSHNLTLAGFSHNRELTNRFVMTDTEDVVSRVPFQTAWAFINAWATQLPESLQHMLHGIETFAPWLAGPVSSEDESPLIGVLPKGRSLMEQVGQHIPQRIKRIIVTGPFFDNDLAFLKHLQKEYHPSEFIIGIDPKTVVIDAQASEVLPTAKFVTTDCLRGGKGYLHAKAVLFEAQDGSEVLISGSANPSKPAWISPANKDGNAETIVIRKYSAKQAVAKKLGLKALGKASPVSPESWREIGNRKPISPIRVASGHAPLIALVTEDGIDVDLSSLKEALSPEIRVLDNHNLPLLTGTADLLSKDHLSLCVPNVEMRRRAALLELHTTKHKRLLAIVHHLADLQDLSRTDRQRALKDALGSLNTEMPMIEELMRVVEKVIFDDDVMVSAHPSGRKRDGNEQVSKEEGAQSEFAIALKDAKRHRKLGRTMISSGDLSVLLDALIHRLGIGLEASIYSAPAIARSEEELIGSDEEIEETKQIDGAALVVICQRKVKTLLRRMIRQLENAGGSNDQSLRAIAQTAAVLGLVHRLCSLNSDEVSWMPLGETLVPYDARSAFFFEATRLLYSKSPGVMMSAIKKPGVSSCVEASMVRGLLLWLAWDSDLVVSNILDCDDPEDLEAHLYGLARLVAMAPDVASDSEAFERAGEAIKTLWPQSKLDDYDPSWLDEVVKWCNEIDRMSKKPPRQSVVKRGPDIGDIVYPTKASVPSLFVVAEELHGKVRLADLDGENELKTYASSYVTVVKAATGSRIPARRALALTRG